MTDTLRSRKKDARKPETIDVSHRVEPDMPELPDPFWPPGVVPGHLSVEKQRDPAIVEAFVEIAGPVWHCEKCGSTQKQSQQNKRFCVDCLKLEAQNTALARKINANWMDEAAELGLAIFERQPEETNIEWLIWTTYRSYYPLKMPTWTELAAKCGCSVATVTKAAAKWSYKVRLVEWARHTDGKIQEKRIAAIKQMNEKQLSMAQTIQSKLQSAIETIDPQLLKPNEIVNLFKVATELERRVTTYVEEKVESDVVEDRKKQVVATRPEDLSEVVDILRQTGLLDNKVLGIEQTTTTRIVAKEDAR